MFKSKVKKEYQSRLLKLPISKYYIIRSNLELFQRQVVLVFSETDDMEVIF